MYRIGTDDEVNAQVEALPDELLTYYAQLLDLLELAPWRSEPYSNAKPAEGILVLERDQRVEIVRVVWIH
jgi:hypothetical protein